jgi:hypothetical protein
MTAPFPLPLSGTPRFQLHIGGAWTEAETGDRMARTAPAFDDWFGGAARYG